MNTNKFKLVTIIADESLEHILESEIIARGARGYTVSQVEGQGRSGARDNAWSGRNVKIETVVTEAICEVILQRLSDHYLEKYPLIVYASDVQVLRAGHFS